MSDPIAIKIDNVSKTFRLPHEKNTSIKNAVVNFYRRKRTFEKQQVLKDVSFEVKQGEFFGIVGRNGSGKSTLLKLLAGIYAPSKGQIHVNGKLTPFIELGVGFNPELTGRENVYLNGALLGFNRKEMNRMYKDIVDFAELERFMDQKLKNYSSGMQVRLAFSIATRVETDILLIDEVLAVGDQSFQEKCFDYFARIKKSGKTVVFVTHDMSNVERFCDRVLVIDKKREANGIYSIQDAVSIYNKLNHEKNASPGIENRSEAGIHIKSLRLLSNAGAKREEFTQGEPLEVEIEIAGQPEQEEKITIGIAFYDKDGTNLAGPNSSGKNLTTGSKKIRYKISKLPFNMGEYYMTVALLDESGTQYHDLIDKGIKFFVNTSKIHYGKIVLEDDWK